VLNVPHYIKSGLRPSLESDAYALLSCFPLLEKQVIRESPGELVDPRTPTRRRVIISTSGSTGTPLRITSTVRARRLNYAFFDEYLGSLGIGTGARKATIGARMIVPGEQTSPPFWVQSLVQPALYLSSYHVSERNLPHYIMALKRFQPEFIDCFPSAGSLIAQHLQRTGDKIEGLKAVLTSSETLTDTYRQNLEQGFGCPVYDQYGCAEMAVFAGQCRNGRYHVRPDYGVLEILADGKPAAVGEEGELICTGLVNPAMPLIRYRIGDQAVWSGVSCTCGLNTPILEGILGRRDDAVVTPDGRRISRLGHTFHGVPVLESQIVQDEVGHVTICVVPAQGFRKEHEAAMLTAIRTRLGEALSVEVKRVSQIGRGPGGKLRTVVSRYRGATQ
jgi:phenylacetate-CoA ligase